MIDKSIRDACHLGEVWTILSGKPNNTVIEELVKLGYEVSTSSEGKGNIKISWKV
jgi:hypothetical protein